MLNLTPTLTSTRFPDTRYMGSKQELLPFIWSALESLKFDTVLDAFSGSGCVAYMLKQHGKSVIVNDHLEFAYHIANGVIANPSETLTKSELDFLVSESVNRIPFIQRTFKGLYFSDKENAFLDNVSANIQQLTTPFKKSLAIASLCRACIKRRPRGIFTYVGIKKYDDGRRDLRMDLKWHFLRAAEEFNGAVFDNGRTNSAFNEDVFELKLPDPDLVYIDPPYVTPHSDNDYLRRYHFVEGLSSYWRGRRVKFVKGTKTKKLQKYPTPFSSRKGIHEALDALFGKFSRSMLTVSYSSNCIPSRTEMISLLANHRKAVSVERISHRYSFGTYNHKRQNPYNMVEEFLFIAV